MTPLQERGIENEINELIDRYATDFNDDDFLEALDIVIDYARTARMAREEELAD